MPELTLGGIALVPVITAVIELLKRGVTLSGRRYALPDEYAPLANGLLSVLAFAVITTARGNVEFEAYAVMVVQAVMVFLAAAGFYHIAVKSQRRAK